MAAIAALCLGVPPPAAAQGAVPTPSDATKQAVGERVAVKLDGLPSEVRGTLLAVDSRAVRLRVHNEEVEFSLDRIQRLDLIPADTVLEGALIGAGASMAWCVYICAEAASKKKLMLQAATIGALLGALVDHNLFARTTIYVAPTGQGRHSPARLGLFFQIAF